MHSGKKTSGHTSRRRHTGIAQCRVSACVALMTGGALLLPAVAVLAAEDERAVIEEVLVTARRMDENLQDVPAAVNAVTGEKLDQLNIRELADLSTVVAGLTLETDSIAPSASMRGVRFDTFASGNNTTVEFYLNDSPISSLSAVQSMFDVGQIEVLRGPQGTLRGRASPSGAITITSRRPDLQDFGGEIDVTVTNHGTDNEKGTINIPLIEGKLATRIAAFNEDGEGVRVDSINSGEESAYDANGARASLRWEPSEALTVDAMHQILYADRVTFFQVESANLEDPSQPASPTLLEPKNRKAVSQIPQDAEQRLARTGLEAAWETSGLMLNYVGSYTRQFVDRKDVDDVGNALPEPEFDNLGQGLKTRNRGQTHELRFSPVDLINDKINYVIGALWQDGHTRNTVLQETPLRLRATNLGGAQIAARVNVSRINTRSTSDEKSIFGNINWLLNENTELSAGVRYIEFESESTILLNGSVLADNEQDEDTTIWLLSGKHNINDDLMVYATAGSSWRPPINVIGDFSVNKTQRQLSFQNLGAEESESIEFGVKSSWMEDRLRINGDVFYQTFDNYPYRAGGQGVFYVRDNDPPTTGDETVQQFNFVAAVPVDVWGVELEATYAATPQLTMSALVSYAKGEIDGGTIPCNDYLPADGNPDSGGATPTVSDIRTATGGDNVAACQADFRSNDAPVWTASLQSQYDFKLRDHDAYVRALVTLYGASENDPTHDFDDVESYATVNLFTGISDPEGKWQLMLFAKNLFDEEEVLERDPNPASVGVTNVNGTVGGAGGFTPTGSSSETVTSTYRPVSMTREREVGINFRYFF